MEDRDMAGETHTVFNFVHVNKKRETEKIFYQTFNIS